MVLSTHTLYVQCLKWYSVLIHYTATHCGCYYYQLQQCLHSSTFLQVVTCWRGKASLELGGAWKLLMMFTNTFKAILGYCGILLGVYCEKPLWAASITAEAATG